MNHRLVHPEPVDGCFGCKALTIQFGTASEEASVINAREKRWDVDLPAYKRLRREGLQPKSIDGAKDLEAKATDRLEIDMGHILPDPADRARAVEAMAMVEEAQWQS